MDTVFLPVSSSQILVGARTEDIQIDTKDLNKNIAECCVEQFISSELADDKVGLINKIGKRSSLVKEGEVEDVLSAIRRDLVATKLDKE